MVVKKKIFAVAAIITILLFVSIYSLNLFLNMQREKAIIERMEEVLDEYQEIQALSLMSNVFGKEMTCLSLENTLAHMDKTLWNTGLKIDKYREATEEFITDPFYIEQKKKFNRNEVIYFSMLKEMKDWCEFNQTVILYFYRKKDYCVDCDAQAFVLTDLNKEIGDEIAIFSFDSDLDLPCVNTLVRFYNITSYPCIVVEDDAYCDLYNKEGLLDVLCNYKELSLCS